MEMDLNAHEYPTQNSLITYIYGSAEVIGLMIANILKLPPKASHSAQMLGRAMQYVNFIRDIDEDLRLGRVYFPQDFLKKYLLKDLSFAAIKTDPETFKLFIRDQISLYRQWQQEAESGYHYIPRRYLIPIKTAAEMYKWTARIIYEDPFIVFSKKVKPSRFQVISRAFINTVTLK